MGMRILVSIENHDRETKDLEDDAVPPEVEKESPKVPLTGFEIPSPFFEQIQASIRMLAPFQKEIAQRNEEILKTFQDSFKLNSKVVESFTAVSRQSEALTQWAKQISNTHGLEIAHQFKGLDNVLSGLNVWRDHARKVVDSFPKIDISFLDKIREAYPPNWSRLVDPKIADEVLYKDGIPIVWVPPSQILDKVLQAPDRESRMAILIGEQNLIVEDCERVVKECVHPDLSGQLPLAIAVIKAWRSHPEAAQALAVNLTDSLIKSFPNHILPIKQYEKIKNTVKVDLDQILFVKIRVWYALAAIYVFFTTHWASSGLPLPKELSRHVSTHEVHIDHFHRENSLLALMLMTSIMRTYQDVS